MYMYKTDCAKGGNYAIDNDFTEICLNSTFHFEVWFKVTANPYLQAFIVKVQAKGRENFGWTSSVQEDSLHVIILALPNDLVVGSALLLYPKAL